MVQQVEGTLMEWVLILENNNVLHISSELKTV